MADGRLRRVVRRGPGVVDDVVAWRLSLLLVALLVVTGLVVGALPHALGTVGGDPVDTNDEPVQESVEDAQQRYQNQVTGTALGEGPWVLLFVALAAGFVAATRSPSAASRRSVVAAASVGVAVGTALGYVALVGLGHLAYAPTENGYLVRSGPVVLRTWTMAGNALGFAVPAAVGSALTATAGRLAVRPGDDFDPDHDAEDGAEPSGDASEGTDDAVGGADDPARSTADDGPDAVSLDETAPSGVPAYDPEARDWDGSAPDEQDGKPSVSGDDADREH
ncbi:hypothetical protein [Halorubellus salinus]|uniref:hypothetical protein n=1 Tax=Halorubellus salinus TaxID=755309 RepID=UPI001D08C5EA|nr:hypothetical protein [Halorubellus salinus]